LFNCNLACHTVRWTISYAPEKQARSHFWNFVFELPFFEVPLVHCCRRVAYLAVEVDLLVGELTKVVMAIVMFEADVITNVSRLPGRF